MIWPAQRCEPLFSDTNMPTVTKEDGTGLSGANSYANVADGDSYHGGHLYATGWTAAVTATKESALIMATRLIDACYRFNGFKANNTQALQWPRMRCLDPDRAEIIDLPLSNNRGPYLDADSVPAPLLQATCELARTLIANDTTDAVDGEGLSQMAITGVMHLQFAKKDAQPIIPQLAQMMLAKYGTYMPLKSGPVQVIRT